MSIKIPVFSCGLFGISDDYLEKYLSLDQRYLENNESTFIVRARGDSMETLIQSNDLLIIDKSLKLEHQSIATFYYNNEAICKQYLKVKDKIILHSLNPKYPDVVVKDDDFFELFGVVKAITRDLL